MSGSFELDTVDRFVVGTVGEPGSRTFFFQLATGDTILTFKCEKMQVAALAEAVRRLLVDLPAGNEPDVLGDLVPPILAEWTVGTIGIGYEPELDRVVVVLEELVAEGDDDGGRVRFFLSRSQAEAFSGRSNDVIGGGRPTCLLCAAPIDPDGFNCSCYN